MSIGVANQCCEYAAIIIGHYELGSSSPFRADLTQLGCRSELEALSDACSILFDANLDIQIT